MGSREAYTGHLRTSPMKMKFSREDTTGSEAFTMWPKDTAPAKKATTAPTCVAKCPRAAGDRVMACFTVRLGVLRMPRSQRGTKISHPKAICQSATAQGYGYAMSAFLL